MNLIIFLLLTLSASIISEGHLRDYFVIWNIGQGQWATAVQSDKCLHFDMGGEYFPWKKIHKACAEKENKIYLSHSDWDHIGALSKKASLKKWKSVCLALAPTSGSKKKKELWIKLPQCESKDVGLKIWSPKTKNKKDSNSQSHIVTWQKILIPGDSTKKEEQTWKNNLDLSKIKTILLGHHGSRTSSSEELMNSLPSTTQAIASARWQRYKHPHPEVTARMKRKQIALIRTEDWGNIWLAPSL